MNQALARVRPESFIRPGLDRAGYGVARDTSPGRGKSRYTSL